MWLENFEPRFYDSELWSARQLWNEGMHVDGPISIGHFSWVECVVQGDRYVNRLAGTTFRFSTYVSWVINSWLADWVYVGLQTYAYSECRLPNKGFRQLRRIQSTPLAGTLRRLTSQLNAASSMPQ